MQYESSITSGLEVMAKVKVFVHATDADADADANGRAMTLAPRTYLSRLAKKCQNAHFFTRFPHCVEVFEEMVGNWRVRVI